MLSFLKNIYDLQLDIVGFLAILGEGSVLINAQVSSLSRIVYLPRILPAPQALLRPSRPSQLDPTHGFVTGAYSGNYRPNINHVANIAIESEDMAPFSVRCIEIKRKENRSVKAKLKSPLSLVAILGCLCSAALVYVSIHFNDGMALLATILLSFLSTLLGLGNKWDLQLPQRPVNTRDKIPKGDVVIRYPRGAFVVVKCTEDVARELFTAPEAVEYLISHPPYWRLLSLIGTLMLMSGVIALGNAQIEAQISFAAAYMIMNAAYWIVAALPPKLNWDLSCFFIKNQHIGYHVRDEKRPVSASVSYTEALWKVILVTKSIEWVHVSNAAPKTTVWDQWLIEAQTLAKSVGSHYDESNPDASVVWLMPDWDPQQAWKDILEKNSCSFDA